MNWATIFSDILKLLPYVVAGVNVIHSNESTETKTQLAQDALNIATQGAVAVLSPQNAQLAQNVSAVVAANIQVAQQIHDAAKGVAQVVAQ